MLLGFRTAGFGDREIQEALGTIHDAGYECVELCLEHRSLRPETLKDDDALRIRDLLGEMGLAAASVSYHGDNDPLDLKVRNTFRAIEIASLFPPRILVMNCEKASRELTREEQFKTVIRRLEELCHRAADKGVTLALEPEPGLVINDSQDMLRIIEEVDSDALRVNLDIGHAYITDRSLADSIRSLGPYLVHLHIEDIKDKEHKHLVPGEGDINFVEAFTALKEARYDGPCVVDLFRIQDDPAGFAKRSLEALRKFLEPR